MLKEPKEISILGLISFINSHVICVIKAKNKKEFGFNKFLQIKLSERLRGLVDFGWVDIDKVNSGNTVTQIIITSWMTQLGLPFHNSVPPWILFISKWKYPRISSWNIRT